MVGGSPLGGASARVVGSSPHLDIAGLATIARNALDPTGAPGTLTGAALLHWSPSDRRLSVNLAAFVARFLAHDDAPRRLWPASGPGFLREVKRPGAGKAARVGMRNTDAEQTSLAVRRFSKEIRGLLESQGVPGDAMTTPGMSVMNRLVDRFGARPAWEADGISTPVRFVPASGDGGDLMARFLTATETLRMDTPWAQKLARSLVGLIAREIDDEDEFDDRQRQLHQRTIEEMAERPDSQVSRFLDFIEDQGMARARLHVAVTMLGQIGEAAAAGEELARYAGKVVALHEWAVADSGGATIELATWTGVKVNLEDWLKRVGSYRPLPVFPEWQSQLFESRSRDRTRVERSVAYGFRVNGDNPETGLPAFDNRIDRLCDIHRGIAGPGFAKADGWRVLGWILETLLLWLSANPDLEPEGVVAAAKAKAEAISADPEAAWGAMLADLPAWKREPAAVASGLREVMRNKSRTILGNVSRRLSSLTLSVGRSIVSEGLFEAGLRPGRDYLRTGSATPGAGQKDSEEALEWFNHLRVDTKPDPYALFALEFGIEIRDQGLVADKARDRKLRLERRWTKSDVLPLSFVPVSSKPKDGRVLTRLLPTASKDWRPECGIEIFYDPVQLKPPLPKEAENVQARHTAKVAACCLFLSTLLHHIGAAAAGSARPPALILGLRLQVEGAGKRGETGENTLYAIGQALEAACGNDVPIRMQGIVAEENAGLRWRQLGAVNAMAAAFPLSFPSSKGASRGSVGVIAYRTRPSDDHPHLDRKGYAMELRVYRFEPEGEGRTFAQLDRGGTFPLDGEEDVGSQNVIKEEIARLARQEVRHVVLLSHHFGNRHLARAAQRHSPHTRTGFIDEIASQFPDLAVYPMRRDLFSAFRVRTKYDGHLFEAENLADQPELDILAEGKKLVPVYTAATLQVVGNDEAGRPQSGFATYFLDIDDDVRTTTFRERARATLLADDNADRKALVDAFRGMHFLEAEKAADKSGILRATLDPLGWSAATVIAGAGELDVMASRRQGRVIFSLTAFAGLVTDILRSDDA